ncbi:MAG: tetratricopeptide repeat protein [Acidobacteria bacterium]|nr:tetratricopeptide repeat protein [Acidobacteriota bacterium]
MARKRRGDERPAVRAPEGAPPPAPGGRGLLLAAVLLVAATIAVYAPVRGFEFVNYDDYHYVIENPRVATGLSARNLAWAWTAFHAGNWHPLTWISHQVDCALYALEPGGHHLTNLVLHAANAVLLLLALFALTGSVGRSAAVAALFALHPLNVESVAWVSERKNVLSTLFWIATMWAWAAYARQPSRRRYVLVAVLLALGLAAKPMVVTLPCVLLLLDVWPLGRWHWSRPDARGAALGLVREKLPLFGLVLLSSALTVAAQKGAGAVTSLTAVPLEARLTNALVAYVRYLEKMFWPDSLSAFYPHPGLSLGAAEVGGAALLLVALSFVASKARGAPYLLVGWLWYLGTMVPVIGLVQVGSQSMADRYAYVPLLGPFVALVWGLADLAAARRATPALAALGLAVLAALGVAAHRQVGHWRSSLALFEHARAVTRDNYVAFTNLGLAYNKEKRWDDAIASFRRALRIQPRSAEAWGHMGLAFAKKGKTDEAIEALSKALAIYPDSLHAHNNLGVALRRRDPARAVDHLRRALVLDPEFAEAHVNLGAAFFEAGDEAGARRAFDDALALAPDAAATQFRVGSVYLERGMLAEADVHLDEALRLDPRHADAHNSRGVVLLRQGSLEPAAAEFRRTLTLVPDHADAHANLGTLLYRQGRGDGAVAELEAALRLAPEHADAHATLGAILAQSGRLAEAVPHFTRAVEADPENVVARNNLGAALLQRGDVDGALEHLRRAVARDPRHADARSNLGVALLQKGDVAGAEAQFRAALESAPGHKNARGYLDALQSARTRR